MSLKKRYLFLILLVCLFAISAVSAAKISNETNMVANDDSSLITESVNEDTLSVSLSEKEIQGSADNGTFTDLQKKINNANEGSIIYLENNYTYDSGFSTSGITIDKNLTIEGNGYTIDALGQSRIFYITSPTVTLNNITFKNGYTTGDGGAIYFDNSVSNCGISGRFINNSATYGGAINFGYHYRPTNVYNSSIFGEFINNSANYGGAICFVCFIHNCSISGRFINNSATYYGGAIDFASGVSSINVYDGNISGVFINNSVKNTDYYYGGGAICFESSVVSNFSIYGRFINNSASNIGGAISFATFSRHCYVTNCSFSGLFINNSASQGDALYFRDGTSDSIIINSIILDSIYNPGNLVAINTWFGNNLSNYESKPYSNCGVWLFLDDFSVPITGVNGKSSVTFTLDNLYNSSSKVISHPDISDLPDVVFKLSATNGYLNKYTARPGESIIFTSTVNKDGVVTATCGDASYSIKIVNLKVDARDVSKYYNGSEEFVVTLSNNAHQSVPGVNVIVNIGDKTVSGLSDSNGQFSVPLDLDPGNYTVTTTASGIKVLSAVNIYSTVESSDVSAIYKDVTFKATILDSTGKPVSNRKVEFDIDGLKLNATSDENGHVSVNIDLGVGDYIITTTNPVTGQVKTNKVAISKAKSSVSISSEVFRDSATLTAEVSGPGDISGEVVFIINGNNYYNEDIADFKASISLINLDVGKYTAKAVYNGDANHNSSASEVITFYVGGYNYVISAPDVVKDYNGPERFNITLTNNNVPVSSANVKISINGTDYNKITDNDGRISMDISDLNAGVYGVTVIYSDVSTDSVIVVNQVSTKTALSYVKNSYNSVTLTAVVSPSTATGKVTFNVNGKDKTVNIKNSKATLTLNDLAPGSYTVKATYGGDVNHKSSVSSNVEFSVDKHYVSIAAPDVTMNYGGSEKLVITLTNQDSDAVSGAELKISLGGKNLTKNTDSKGKVSLDIDLDSGSYEAVIVFEGNAEYKKATTSAKVTVKQLSSKTTLSYVNNTYNSVTLTALVDPSDATGDVVFNVNGKDVPAAVSNGKAAYKLADLTPGHYAVKATYGGDVNHKSSSDNISFNIREDKVEVSAPDLIKYYKGSERFVVTVKENNVPLAGKNVTINLNGKPYTRTTDSDGQASMAINLDSGKYDATVEYDGIKAYSTVTVNPTIVAKDFTKIFRNNTQYYGEFRNSDGSLLRNTDVKFNINGVFYTRTTNDQGVAKMNINLNPGSYILTATNPTNGEMQSVTITVLTSIVENYDLTKYYKNDSQYRIRLLDSQGNPVGAGVSVEFNINGVFYTRTSDAQGYVKMNINLNPGTYVITANYNGLMASNTIKVLPIIKAEDLVMSYRDGSKFEATLLDGQGKPYANQNMTFNINGVFYTRPTDDNGIARLNINLMAGEYIITSMYENGAATSNKVTIRS